MLRFTKMHGAGNDYVYVDGRGESRDWPALAEAMSDRHQGVGSDGLLVALPSDSADLRMAMFNADGSEGEMCGNGIRCLVAFALCKGIVPTGTSPVSVETLAGRRTVTPLWENGRVSSAMVGMGEPVLEPDEIPVLAPRLDRVMEYPLQVDGQSFVIGCVSMGNPHAVAFIDTPVDEVPLHEIGPMVEHHPMFPKRVNFEIVNLIDSGRVKARVWERGSGLTEACGTGACAIGVVGLLSGRTRSDLEVALPGGDLRVQWDGRREVVMEGPVQSVFDGEWPD